MTNKETWDKWDAEVHNSPDAKKRIISAQKADLTPLHLEETDGIACFQGGHGRYETLLDYCPCGDFHRRKLPCKHIYRLVMELGLFEGNLSKDATRIKIPKTGKGLDLIPALDIIESCSEDAQKIAYELFLCMHNGTYQMAVYKTNYTTELVDHHICYDCDNVDLRNGLLDRKEIVNLLKEKGFNVGVRKTPLEELVELAKNNLGDYISQKYSGITVLAIEDHFSDAKAKIYKLCSLMKQLLQGM